MTYKVLKVILKEAEKSNLISSKVLQGIAPCYGKKKKIVLYNKGQVSSFVSTAKIYHNCYFEILLALICGLRTGLSKGNIPGIIIMKKVIRKLRKQVKCILQEEALNHLKHLTVIDA